MNNGKSATVCLQRYTSLLSEDKYESDIKLLHMELVQANLSCRLVASVTGYLQMLSCFVSI